MHHFKEMIAQDVDNRRDKETLFMLVQQMSQTLFPALLQISEATKKHGEQHKEPWMESAFEGQEKSQEDHIDEAVDTAFEASYKYAKKMLEFRDELEKGNL